MMWNEFHLIQIAVVAWYYTECFITAFVWKRLHKQYPLCPADT